MKTNRKSKRAKKASNLFAKHRSAIWIQLCSIIILIIFLPFTGDYLQTLFSKYIVFAAPVTVFYFLFFNLAYIATYNASKKSLITNLIAIFVLLIFGSLAIFMVPTEKKNIIIFAIGIYLSIIPTGISTIISFKRGSKVDNYIGFKETLFNLRNFKFQVNGEDKKVELYIAIGHINVEVNRTRRKFVVSKIHSLRYECATIFGKPGIISFKIDEDLFEYKFYSGLEDLIMFALAYNLIRVNEKVFDIK